MGAGPVGEETASIRTQERPELDQAADGFGATGLIPLVS